MARLTRKRTKKVGLPAESLVYTGDVKGGAVTVDVMDYDEREVREKNITTVQECIAYRDKPTVTWINVEGVHDVSLLEKMGECFGLHRLVMEDIASTDQRPKAEDFGEYLYIVFKMLSYDAPKGEVVPEQISLVLGRNFVLSFQEGLEGDVFNAIRGRIREGKGRIRKTGADYLAYALVDAVVDNYFLILEGIGENIESLEEAIVSRPTQETVQSIYRLKRELLILHKSVWPLREVVGILGKHDSPLIRETTVPYLRDVYDHVIQVIDTVEIYREMLSEMLDSYLSSVSNRMNEIMKVLTIIATIFMPLTFIAGVYGMNFRRMPELEWRYGYPLVLAVMLGIGLSMVRYFRKKKWF